jgi:hypothetical protein
MILRLHAWNSAVPRKTPRASEPPELLDATNLIRDRAEAALHAIAAARPRLIKSGIVSQDEHELAEQVLSELALFGQTRRTGENAALTQGLAKAVALIAGSADAQLYLSIATLLALKLAASGSRAPSADRLIAELDAMTFDIARPKNATLALLRALRAEVEERITLVRNSKAKRFRFLAPPELYRLRKNKKERPDQFFLRVYGNELPRGLTQGDIRGRDPAFYNVFHVWCARNEKRMSRYVPSTRFRPRGS